MYDSFSCGQSFRILILKCLNEIGLTLQCSFCSCWLDLEGTAVLPSVIPVLAFGALSCLLLISVFDSSEPVEEINAELAMRGK